MKIVLREKTYLVALVLAISFSACGRFGNNVNVAPVETNLAATATPTPELQFPQSTGFLSDFAGVLADRDKSEIESVLKALRDKAQIDFAVAIIESTDRQDIFEYSLAMAREWKIGAKNGGVLLLIAIKDRKWHIQIDKRLEQDLSNDEVKNIGEVVVSDFKGEKYASGIKKCVEKMISVLAEKQHFEPIGFRPPI